MITDARQLPEDETLSADVCIIGAGAAGVSLALEMAGNGLSVILAEGGAEDGSTDHGDVYGGRLINPRHPPVDLYRGRCLGGTTSLWGGRCAPLEEIDFETRDWVPHSGWPIPYAALRDALPRALRYLDLGSDAWTAGEALTSRPDGLIPGFADPVLRIDRLDRFSPPVRFGVHYREALRTTPGLTVLLNATALRLEMSGDGQEVRRLAAASRPGRDLVVVARAYVVAAGGLESTRLLLASGENGEGIGEGRAHLGRFYMSHLQGKAGVLAMRRDIAGITHQYEQDRDGVYVRRRLGLAADEQRHRHLLNLAARYEHPAIPDPGHHSPILSAVYLSRHFLAKEYKRRIASATPNGDQEPPSLRRFAGHFRNVMLGFPELLRFSRDWFPKRRGVYRRLPYLTLPNKDNRFHIDYYAEQAPNPLSRVSLIAQRDAYGRPRLCVDWQVTTQDVDNVVASFALMRDRLAASGLARLDFDEAELRDGYCAIGGHHIGTTRMADSPARGVVDAQCRLFGVGNLYVASASVFPTCGHASPTLTTVALAVRLADHLRSVLARSSPELLGTV